MLKLGSCSVSLKMYCKKILCAWLWLLNNKLNAFFSQVKVWSSKVFKVETVEGEEELQELERFSVWSWFRFFLREQQNETVININLFCKKTCFKVDPTAGAQYTVKPIRSK